MKPQFTREGVEVQTFDEIFNELVDAYKLIYGDDIVLEPNTPDGQRIGVMAKMSADSQAFGLSLYQMFDPDFSIGDQQNKLIKIAGITRSTATQSSAVVAINTDRDLTLKSGFTVSDENNQNWVLKDDTATTAGTNNVTLLSEKFGEIQALPNTITTIEKIVIGVLSATNPQAAIPGSPSESDAALKERRNLSLENPAYSTTGSLYAKLANIDGVVDLQVYENKNNPNNPDNPWTLEMLPNSIWCVVEGGTEADIAEVIAKNKTGGTARNGEEVAYWVEHLVKPDGTQFDFTHKIRFDRPTAVNLHIRMDVSHTLPFSPIDEDLIKDQLATKTYLIGNAAQANELYGLVYQAGKNFIAENLEISDDGVTWTSGQIVAGYKDVITITKPLITITEV